jgi:hypothetical protein
MTLCLPIVPYGHETWYVASREVGLYTFLMFEKRLLRRIFGPKRKEVVRDLRELFHGELRNLDST